MQIVVLDGYTINPGDLSWENFEQFGTLTVYDRTPSECTALRLVGAEAAFTNKTRISAADLEHAGSLKYIGLLNAGYEGVDLYIAKKRGIAVANVPDFQSGAVAQFTIALLMEICHSIGHHNREVHKGRWTAAPDYCFWDTPQIELAGLTFGVFGTGHVGCAVAKLAKALGMQVIGTSPHKKKEFVGQYVTKEELLARSDVLSLHCPPKTGTVIDAAAIQKMKDGAILLNTAAGALVNAADLASALATGKLYAAGIDVAEREPIIRSNPLLNAPNCFVTPHIAGSSFAVRKQILQAAAENLQAFLDGQPVNRLDL